MCSSDLVEAQLADPELKIFAEQVSTADAWFRGTDAGVYETVFKDMIKAVIRGEDTVERAIKYGEDRINQIL